MQRKASLPADSVLTVAGVGGAPHKEGRELWRPGLGVSLDQTLPPLDHLG